VRADPLVLIGLRAGLVDLLGLRRPALDEPDRGDDVEEERHRLGALGHLLLVELG
jgi:hypothetical protein